jgi:hypothetical protein
VHIAAERVQSDFVVLYRVDVLNNPNVTRSVTRSFTTQIGKVPDNVSQRRPTVAAVARNVTVVQACQVDSINRRASSPQAT